MELMLGKSAYERAYGRMPPVVLENRFFEQNPTDQQTQTALLSRPGTDDVTGFGAGPIRSLFSLDGVFNGDLFVVSGADGSLFRYSRDGLTKTTLVGTIFGDAFAPMAATRNYLFIADSNSLQYYDGVGSLATATLTITVNPADGDAVTLGSTTYTFNTVLGGANSVLIGADIQESLTNLSDAIAATAGQIGSTVGTGTVANTDATFAVTDPADGTGVATAITSGTAGNGVTSTETGANMSWSSTTLSGGTADGLNGIPTPDDVQIVSLAVIAGYVLLVAAGGDRVYWIEPTTDAFGPPDRPEIDPLNFLTAEQLPDEIIEVRVVGDEIWFVGVESTEVWYVTGAQGVPFDRIKGRAFSRGAIEGTFVVIGNRKFIVGNDGVVYKLGGGLQRISTHAIEEAIRAQRKAERNA
jgi:hypothetical protein